MSRKRVLRRVWLYLNLQERNLRTCSILWKASQSVLKSQRTYYSVQRKEEATGWTPTQMQRDVLGCICINNEGDDSRKKRWPQCFKGRDNFWKFGAGAIVVYSVLRRAPILFQSDFSTECAIALPLGIYIIFSFPYGHPVVAYIFFLLFPSPLFFFLSILRQRVIRYFICKICPIQLAFLILNCLVCSVPFFLVCR